MCGTVVSASASECPDCGEAFSPIENEEAEPELEEKIMVENEEAEPELEEKIMVENGEAEPELEEEIMVENGEIEPGYSEETTVEETEELFVQDDSVVDEPEMGICEACDGPLSPEGKCPTCQPPETAGRGSEGCPLCASKMYTTESGDLVSCSECGNVYVKKMFEPTQQNWKWKFWTGLLFILVGNIGVALGSYIHNVVQWSPLGGMYLGYGWMDQFVGAIGIVLFILGLLLFAWSFKREREVQCPSCKVVIRESQFDVFEPEEEEAISDEIGVESALEEIGEAAECPTCGSSVSIFDDSCANCGAVFEMDIDFEEPVNGDVVTEEEPKIGEPERFLTASEIDEDGMIMDSLELEAPENELNGNGIGALEELESAFQVSMEEGTTCLKCGVRVGKGLDTCPGCGETLTGGE